jgi:hypothetical protein
MQNMLSESALLLLLLLFAFKMGRITYVYEDGNKT